MGILQMKMLCFGSAWTINKIYGMKMFVQMCDERVTK